METKSKIVYWAENNLEADLIVQMLKQYDIPARQLQESFGALNNLSFGAFGEIGIEVPENRAA